MFHVWQFPHKHLINPPSLVPLISTVTNVLGDGNCGFRSAAVGLGRDSNAWPDIRLEMIQEIESENSMCRKEDFIKHVWHFSYEQLMESLGHLSGPAQTKYWMHFPTHGYILADTYQRPVLLFSKSGNCTYLPLSYPPTDNPPLCFIMIQELCHLISFKFKDHLWAAPTVDPSWKWYANKEALSWKIKIKPNLDHGRLALAPPPTRRSTRNRVIVVEGVDEE